MTHLLTLIVVLPLLGAVLNGLFATRLREAPFGRTFGEVERAEKDRVSHRGKAFARLRAFLAGMRDAG